LSNYLFSPHPNDDFGLYLTNRLLAFSTKHPNGGYSPPPILFLIYLYLFSATISHFLVAYLSFTE
jgi:hypothetical protein